MARGDDGKRDEGFLGRWARRKHEAQQPASPVVAGPPAGPVPSETAAPAPTTEMVEPPSLDLVDKDFDLAHWLKQNVPEEWKLKALRRAWESDPAIAGYQDPARDYALDWNTPGGAPGYGPLSESDNVEEMLANIFGKPPEDPHGEAGEAVRNDAADIRLSSNTRESEDFAASQQTQPLGEVVPRSERSKEAGESRKTDEKPTKIEVSARGEPVAAQNQPDTAPSLPHPRRRGGGATPL